MNVIEEPVHKNNKMQQLAFPRPKGVAEYADSDYHRAGVAEHHRNDSAAVQGLVL